MEQDNLEKFRECLIDLTLSDEVIESKKKQCYPDEVLEFLLTKLLAFRNLNKEGGWDVFITLLSEMDYCNERQRERFLKHIEENYGYYIEPKLSYIMAEWFGGCRDEWAINTIEKWSGEKIHEVPRDNLKTALYEFTDSLLPYTAEPGLIKRAVQLKDLLDNP